MGPEIAAGDVLTLMQSKGWREVVRRLRQWEQSADKAVETRDPYLHGKAVGERNVARRIISLPELMLKDLGVK